MYEYEGMVIFLNEQSHLTVLHQTELQNIPCACIKV